MLALGHIAGIPVEETLLSFAPVGAAGVGALACVTRARLRRYGRRREDGRTRTAVIPGQRRPTDEDISALHPR